MKKHINRSDGVLRRVAAMPHRLKNTEMSNCRSSERGAASMVLAAMLLILSGGLIGTYYVVSANKTLALENQAQVDALDEAVANINGYALGHGEFPCVASVPDGAATCDNAQKGWYPAETLDPPTGLPTDPNYDPSRSVRTAKGFQVRYALSSRLRSAGSGIAEYKPQIVGSTSYPFIKSTLDLCESIRSLARPNTGGRWTTGDGLKDNAMDPALLNVKIDGKPINVAYAVAVLPPGADESAWGSIADLKDAELNGPSSPVSTNQSPLVRYMDAPALFTALSCNSALMSVDGMADAANWSALTETARGQLVHDADHFAKVQIISTTSVSQELLVLSDVGYQAGYYLASATAKLLAYVPLGFAQGIAASNIVLFQSNMVISKTAPAVFALTLLAAGETANAVLMSKYKDKADNATVWKASSKVIEQADNKGVNP